MPNISQRHIRSQMNRYFALNKRGHRFNSALCHGFAVVYAAMDSVGTLPWWQQALACIADWDGSEKGLAKKYRLPGAQEDITLNELIERAASYISFNFCPELLEGVQSQIDLFKPGVFEIYDPSLRTYITIDGNTPQASAVGTFKENELAALLQPEYVTSGITLLYSHNHTCALTYHEKESAYYLYTTNEDDWPSPITDMQKLVAEIIKEQGDSLAIHIIDIHQRNKAATAQFTEDYRKMVSLKLLQKDSIPLFTMFAPAVLHQLLSQVGERPRHESIAQVMRSICFRSPSSGFTALHYFAKFTPDSLELLIEIASRERNGQALICQIACADDKYNCTAMLAVAIVDIQILFKLLKVINIDERALAQIRAALFKESNKENSVAKLIHQHMSLLIESCDVMETEESYQEVAKLSQFLDSIDPRFTAEALKKIDGMLSSEFINAYTSLVKKQMLQWVRNKPEWTTENFDLSKVIAHAYAGGKRTKKALIKDLVWAFESHKRLEATPTAPLLFKLVLNRYNQEKFGLRIEPAKKYREEKKFDL